MEKTVLRRRVRESPEMPMDSCRIHSFRCNSGGGGIYCLGFVGAVIYYVSTSTGFWSGVLGIIKAAVWPAFLVFELLKFLAA